MKPVLFVFLLNLQAHLEYYRFVLLSSAKIHYENHSAKKNFSFFQILFVCVSVKRKNGWGGVEDVSNCLVKMSVKFEGSSASFKIFNPVRKRKYLEIYTAYNISCVRCSRGCKQLPC